MPDRGCREPRHTRARPVSSIASANRYPSFPKAEFRGLFEPCVGVTDRAYVNRESDFAENYSIRWNRRLVQRRNESRRDREIRRRLDNPQSAGNVEVNI